MNTDRMRITRVAVYVVVPLLVASLLFGYFLLVGGSVAGTSASYSYGVRDLKGATPAQVGAFAVQYAAAQGDVRSGTPQVLLARAVTRGDMAALGLGCLPSFGAIEEPPLMLVIMKGDFQPKGGGGTNHAFVAKYLAYVFDVWSAQPVSRTASVDGGVFKQVLNDPKLPASQTGTIACPTDVPSTKTLHYGDYPPTPTLVEPPSQVPSSPVPSPISTTEVVTPVP